MSRRSVRWSRSIGIERIPEWRCYDIYITGRDENGNEHISTSTIFDESLCSVSAEELMSTLASMCKGGKR